MKDIEGVYKVEMLGPYGWEQFSTAFIQDGQYRGGSAYHFTVGSYRVDGEQFNMVGNVSQHVEHRPLFGEKDIKICRLILQGQSKTTSSRAGPVP